MPDLPDHPNLPIDWAEGIATITIDRPETRNSLTPEMVDALFAARPVLDRDPGISVIVLHRSGPRVLRRARSAHTRQPRHRHRCEHRGRQPVVEHDRLPERARELARNIVPNDLAGVGAMLDPYRTIETSDPEHWRSVEREKGMAWQSPGFDHTEISRRLDAIMARGRAQKEQR